MTSPFHADPGRDQLPDWLRAGLRARVEGEIGLPVLPDTACRVMAACQDEHTDLGELAQLVTHDQSLATHVLRVANSVGFGARAPVRSLRQALGRLGLSTVSDVAIAVAIRQRVFAVPGHEERIRELWLHATAAACYAQDIALLLGRDRDAAFLCGLLHDVGMPIVMQAVCDLERGHAQVAPAVLEQAMAEFHCEFGARIAQRWRLGSEVGAAVRFHHDPSSAGPESEMVAVVTLADQLAYWAPDDSKDESDFTLEPVPLLDPSVSVEHLPTLLQARGRILELARAFQ